MSINIHKVYVYIFTQIYRFGFILPITLHPLFRDDDKLLTKVKSEEFQELLRTDPTTVDGEAKVVKYFDIADEWANLSRATN